MKTVLMFALSLAAIQTVAFKASAEDLRPLYRHMDRVKKDFDQKMASLGPGETMIVNGQEMSREIQLMEQVIAVREYLKGRAFAAVNGSPREVAADPSVYQFSSECDFAPKQHGASCTVFMANREQFCEVQIRNVPVKRLGIFHDYNEQDSASCSRMTTESR